jgi:hypothetical protein
MCDSVNNDSTETVHLGKEEWLADATEDKNGHINTNESKEYQVTLEKTWGTVGLHLEVCISQRSVLLCFVVVPRYEPE